MPKLVVLPIIALAITVSGCTAARGKAYTSTDWRLSPPAFGKVMLMPARYEDPDERDVARDKANQIHCATREALAALPGIQFVEAPADTDHRSLSDFGAVMAAREAGADTVCLLTIGDYGESFWITIFLPTFGGNSRVQYTLRLVDVKSGNLLLETVRARSRGGYFFIPSEGSAQTELKKDLSLVLAGKVGTAAPHGH